MVPVAVHLSPPTRAASSTFSPLLLLLRMRRWRGWRRWAVAWQMSAKAGVRILPVSIGGCHRWMPPSCLLPLGFPGRSVHIQIHPPVETAGRPEDEVSVAADGKGKRDGEVACPRASSMHGLTYLALFLSISPSSFPLDIFGRFLMKCLRPSTGAFLNSSAR